jgi:hypothetical protein
VQQDQRADQEYHGDHAEDGPQHMPAGEPLQAEKFRLGGCLPKI